MRLANLNGIQEAAMSVRTGTRLSCAIALVLVLAGIRSIAAQNASNPKTDKKPERFSAVVVNLETPFSRGTAAQPVDITLDRYSTDAERTQFMNTLLEAPERALQVLQKLPRIGNIRSPESVGYDLRFAMRTPGTDGAEKIMIVTDRPIGYYEASQRPRSIDYPFTVIDLQINSNGRGSGKMTVGTKITADREERTIVLENYSVQPVMLNDVRREK
jgi:hypothetical protein